MNVSKPFFSGARPFKSGSFYFKIFSHCNVFTLLNESEPLFSGAGPLKSGCFGLNNILLHVSYVPKLLFSYVKPLKSGYFGFNISTLLNVSNTF